MSGGKESGKRDAFGLTLVFAALLGLLLYFVFGRRSNTDSSNTTTTSTTVDPGAPATINDTPRTLTVANKIEIAVASLVVLVPLLLFVLYVYLRRTKRKGVKKQLKAQETSLAEEIMADIGWQQGEKGRNDARVQANAAMMKPLSTKSKEEKALLRLRLLEEAAAEEAAEAATELKVVQEAAEKEAAELAAKAKRKAVIEEGQAKLAAKWAMQEAKLAQNKARRMAESKARRMAESKQARDEKKK